MGKPMGERRVRVIGLFVRFSAALYRSKVRSHNKLKGATLRVISENCLRPWLCDGDVIWSDATVEPHDGDLVLIGMTYRRVGMVGVGGECVRESVKQLRIVNGERFFTCADGWMHCDERSEILGTVTAWYRPGWWRRPAVRKVSFPVPALRVVRGQVEVLAVAAIVEDQRRPRGTANLPWVDSATPAQLEEFDRESRDVVAELDARRISAAAPSRIHE